jgi:hypothetical protein
MEFSSVFSLIFNILSHSSSLSSINDTSEIRGGASYKIHLLPPPVKIYEGQEITTLELLNSLIRQTDHGYLQCCPGYEDTLQ